MRKGVPRFMLSPRNPDVSGIDRSIMYCSPVTVYTAKRDGTFIARCHSVPGMVVEGENFDATVQKATEAYQAHCKTGIWN